jgi:hypothetical protein
MEARKRWPFADPFGNVDYISGSHFNAPMFTRCSPSLTKHFINTSTLHPNPTSQSTPTRSVAPSHVQCLRLSIVPRLLLLHDIHALTVRIAHILLSLRRYLRFLKLSATLTPFFLHLKRAMASEATESDTSASPDSDWRVNYPTTRLNIPYSSVSPLNTVDIYFPFPSVTVDNATPRYWIMYVPLPVFPLAQLTDPATSTEAPIATPPSPPRASFPPCPTSHPPLSPSKQSLP